MMARLFLLAAVVAVAGCDTSIESPPSLGGAYTLWGALDPTAETQAIRVVRVADTLVVRSPAPLPVTITSTDLGTGQQTTWRDSVVTFRDGSVGHVYGARFRPAYGSRHRIVLRRNLDAKETTVSLTVPPRSEPVARLFNSAEGARMNVLWPGVEQVNRSRVTYLVQIGRIGNGVQTDAKVCDTLSVSVALPGHSGRSEPTDAGWTTSLTLSGAYSFLFDSTPVPDPNGELQIGLRRIIVRGEVATAEWRARGGATDFESLAVPDVFGNVEGGFGFVGAAYRSEIVVRPEFRELFGTNFVDTAARCRDSY